jgi:3-oxoacyl-[acyl-carrier protein] reductase
MDLRLRDQRVLVAGSSRGIGLAIARAFVDEGSRVVMTGRDTQALQTAAASMHASDRVLPVAGDLARAEGVAAVVQEASARWGGVDVLVANVGSGTARGGWALEDTDWDRAFAVNLHVTRRLAEAVLPAMIDRRAGSLVFIASIVGLESVNAPLTYSAAKAALVSYAKNLARDVARQGVRVNAVAPGNVLFDGGSWARKLAEDSEKVQRYIDAEVPAGRFGTPDEIADIVTFLASDRARFVTGACIVADGGQTRSY